MTDETLKRFLASAEEKVRSAERDAAYHRDQLFEAEARRARAAEHVVMFGDMLAHKIRQGIG